MLVLLVCSAPAQTDDRFRPLRGKADAQPPRPPRAAANPCAAYGPGFARVEGSDTCIKIGGGVSVGGSSGMTMPR